MTHELVLASIPSPDQGVWYLGPLPIRAYALSIIAGVLVAVWLGERRWVARGGVPGQVGDIAVWAVPFGIVGGRLYHVATDWRLYFGEGRDPVTALYVWQGGLGIWGAVALGAVGAYIGCRVHKVRLVSFGDAIAPGIVIAQAIGRWGNWFNQELYGRPTTLPWGLEIDPDRREAGYEEFSTFHPTFLYECLWNLGVAGLLIWADRRFRLGYGRVFALYIMGYTAGRGWIEYLRIDKVQEDDVFGLRLNVWTSIVLFAFGLAWFAWSARRHPGREESVLLEVPHTNPLTAAGADPDNGSAADPDNGSAADPDNGSAAGPDNGSAAGPDNGSAAGPDNGSGLGADPDSGSTPR